MTGLVILAVAVAAALAFGLHRRNADGRFGDRAARGRPLAGRAARGASRGRVETPVETPVEAPVETPVETTWDRVLAAVPAAQPGDRATLVQFSSAFCAPCRTTRIVLADIARTEEGVRHVEVDAEQHLDLVRALDVRRTPTTLVLDADGRELVRAAGAPRKQQVLATIPVQGRRALRGGVSRRPASRT